MTQGPEAPPSVDWQPWGAAAFAAAHAAHKHVLLWITTNWSAGCGEMAQRTFTDAGVCAAIAEHYIPVRIDADDRPDLHDRYDLGGVPTTAVLDADGFLIGGGTFVPPDRLRRALLQLASTASAARQPVTTPTASAQTLDDEKIAAVIHAGYDAEHGGFLGAPKFPHVAAIRLALRRSEAADLEWVQRSLEAIGWGALSDDDGGFFRYGECEDWSQPRREKLLGLNASLIELFIEAGAAGLGSHLLDRAEAAIAFVERALQRQDGTWRTAGSVRGGRVLVDANALAVSAFLRAAVVLHRDDLGARAGAVLDRLLLSAYTPGGGVAHSAGGTRGLLTDNIAMASACLDAWDLSGQLPHRMMAEELVHYVLRTMWDSPTGCFRDRSADLDLDDPAGARLAVRPFVNNCEAVLVLRRLARATGEALFDARAADVQAAMRPVASTQGPLAAHFLLASSAIDD